MNYKENQFISKENKTILVTGASGYIGGRLVRSLLQEGFSVRVFVRDKDKVKGKPWAHEVEIMEGNAQEYNDALQALRGIHTAYYLLHSLQVREQFERSERDMAYTFSKAAKEANVKQIVYLGAIANDTKQSQHLVSRAVTGEMLRLSGVPVIELRAGIVLGSGSASFEILRYLTHRLPIMTTPKWVSNRTQPIAIRDVLYYLTSISKLPQPHEGIFDIGGPEVVTYADMMQTFANISGLKKRIIIKVPVLTPKLSSHWLGLVTPVPLILAKHLVSSLVCEVVADPKKSIDKLIPMPNEGLLDVASAISLALHNTTKNQIETRWSDASYPSSPWQTAQGDPEWSGEIVLKDIREAKTDVSIHALWRCIEEIGGDTGWYGSSFLWVLRGGIDRLLGGVGLRRGRRDAKELRVGDSVDFWRVEEIERESHLKLYAEMILPGKAWLTFRLRQEENGVCMTQEASFTPRGIGGHLYWYLVFPFHALVFPSMLNNIIRTAKRREKKNT